MQFDAADPEIRANIGLLLNHTYSENKYMNDILRPGYSLGHGISSTTCEFDELSLEEGLRKWTEVVDHAEG